MKNIKNNFQSKTIIKDTIISSIPKVISVIAGVLTTVLLARGLGANGLGEYTLIISIATLVTSLSDLGINQSAIRFASQAATDNDKEAQNAVLRWAFRIRMLLLFFITLILFIAAPYIANNLWHIPHLINILRLSLLIGIFTTLAAIPTVYFQSLQKFKTNALVQTIQTIISTGGIILIAVINKWSVSAVILSSIVAAFFSAAFFFHIVPKQIFFIKSSFSDFFIYFFKISKDQRIKDKFQKEVSSFTKYLTTASIVSIISTNISIWILGNLAEASIVGEYSVAIKLSLPITILISAIQTILVPKLAPLTGRLENSFAIKKILRTSFPVFLVFILYSIFVPLFIPYIFGREFSGVIIVSQLLCIRYALNILYEPINILGYNFGLAKYYVNINFIQCIIFIFLNIILIPFYGLFGIVIALFVQTLIGVTLITGRVLYKVKNYKK